MCSYHYEIIDVLNHDDNELIDKDNIIILIKECGSYIYRTVTVRYEDLNFKKYTDWTYINNKNNLFEFTDRVKKFNENKRRSMM